MSINRDDDSKAGARDGVNISEEETSEAKLFIEKVIIRSKIV